MTPCEFAEAVRLRCADNQRLERLLVWMQEQYSPSFNERFRECTRELLQHLWVALLRAILRYVFFDGMPGASPPAPPSEPCGHDPLLASDETGGTACRLEKGLRCKVIGLLRENCPRLERLDVDDHRLPPRLTLTLRTSEDVPETLTLGPMAAVSLLAPCVAREVVFLVLSLRLLVVGMLVLHDAVERTCIQAHLGVDPSAWDPEAVLSCSLRSGLLGHCGLLTSCVSLSLCGLPVLGPTLGELAHTIVSTALEAAANSIHIRIQQSRGGRSDGPWAAVVRTFLWEGPAAAAEPGRGCVHRPGEPPSSSGQRFRCRKAAPPTTETTTTTTAHQHPSQVSQAASPASPWQLMLFRP